MEGISMKHFITAALAALIALPATAAPKKHDVFTCKLKDEGQKITVQFAVKNLDIPDEASLVPVKGVDYEDDWAPIVVTPKTLKSGMYAEANVLNDQGGDLRVDKEKLKLFGDG